MPSSSPPVFHTYLALGDSYTIGESVDAAERWSVQLATMLVRKGKHIGMPDFIAKTGWTTSELAEGIKNAANRRKYSLVSLLIGVNNQYRGESMAVYQAEFQTLLKTAVDFAGSRRDRVFVLSIPDWGVTPYAEGRDTAKIAGEIDAFNRVATEACEKAGVAFIDITDLSRTAAADPTLVAADRLHFSGKMYRSWATRALPVVERMLDDSP